uniref:rRNA adenine N(6)-methyltransferase n=2 Tax=Loa loa TaxID=7209 RepID=A0A1I7VAQ7_LOALO
MATNFSRLPPLPSLKNFLYAYRLQAKKILSQNYLMDMNLTRKIVRQAVVKEGDYVIEIGPGPGSITRAILETNCRRLDVIEIDHRFIPPLEVLKEASEERMFIHRADILKTNIEQIWSQAGLERVAWEEDRLPMAHIIGNLPFNIASPLIIKFLREMLYRQGPWSFGRIPLLLTFQMEVAERLCSPVDSPFRARISIMSAFVTEPKLLFQIPGRCFVPSPKVNVGVVRFIPRQDPLIKTSFEVVEKVCRRVFNYRQKYVVKGIRSLYPEELAKNLADDLLRRCRIDPTTTAICLGVEQFADICYVYEEHCRKYPGVFLYEHSNQGRTLEELARLPNAIPPPNPFAKDFPSEGVKLSDAIISMRKPVERARVRLCRRLIRQRKLLQKSKDEKKARKVDRIAEEIDRCKKVCRDDVSKFALINLKALSDLLKKTKIPIDERVLYKLACQGTVIKCVEEFRIKYPNWQHEVSFLLQRLGLQYKSKRDAKKYMLQQNETKELVETSLGKKIENTQDVKMLVKKEIRKAVKKEENLEKKKKKDRVKSDESNEIPAPVISLPKLELPKSVIAKGQAVIKLLNLDGNQDDEFPSVSAPDKSKDVTLQGNTEENTSIGNDEAIRSILPVKTRDVQKRKRDFEYEGSEKRGNDVRQDRSGAVLSSKEVLGNTMELLGNQNLHPSWIAKKQEHEALKKLKASCKGKRIVFNDD